MHIYTNIMEHLNIYFLNIIMVFVQNILQLLHTARDLVSNLNNKCQHHEILEWILSFLIVDYAKCLGVLLDSMLDFNKHILLIIVHGKANSALALYCNCIVRSQAYFLYVQPILEYSSTV